MNVKLLKKVRKRFSITYYPDGVYIARDSFYEGPLVFLYDGDNPEYGYEIRVVCQARTMQMAIDELKDAIIQKLKNDGYGAARHKRVNNKGIKVWP